MNKRQRKKRLKKSADLIRNLGPWYRIWKDKEQLEKEYEEHMEKVGLHFHNACYSIENLTRPG